MPSAPVAKRAPGSPLTRPALSLVAMTRPHPIDLDALSDLWRRTFAAAESALDAASAGGLSSLGAIELALRRRRLAQERETTAALLDALAHDHHVRLRRSLSPRRTTKRMLGLPLTALACLFDLDGVLTASAHLHAAAWAEAFDEFLARRAAHAGEGLAHFVRPFDPRGDYFAHLHGRPRLHGVRAFLASRGISLPDGRADDPPGAETVFGLANRKNEALRRLLDREGVAAFEGSRRYLEAARETGLRTAVVSASANTAEFLARAGLADLVDELVDGDTMRSERLRWKPAPDALAAACGLLSVPAGRAVAFETTRAGIAAARSAGVGCVVAVKRLDRSAALRDAGADAVVDDLADLLDRALFA